MVVIELRAFVKTSKCSIQSEARVSAAKPCISGHLLPTVTYDTKSIFSATSNMCLMGDIKAVAYFSWWHSVHLSICIIRIFSYFFFESLDRHYKKVFTFLKNVWLYYFIQINPEFFKHFIKQVQGEFLNFSHLTKSKRNSSTHL